MRSFGDAAGSGAEQSTGHAQPDGASQQDQIKEALKARAALMFSGEAGEAVASGIKDDAAAAEKPDYGLVRGAIEVVNDLDDALFDAHAAHRPCGVLDAQASHGDPGRDGEGEEGGAASR